MTRVLVSGLFDDLRSRDVRFLQEAARLGELTVRLRSDAGQQANPPLFPQAERAYLLDSLRYVSRVELSGTPADPDNPLLGVDPHPDVWAVPGSEDSPAMRDLCTRLGIDYRVIPQVDLSGFPPPASPEAEAGRKKVIVTGCYDWLHSGHVRFFEEVSTLGELYVSLGSDRTIRALKGNGHPLLVQEERLYMVQSVRYVSQAFIASGSGYLDAEPEIEALKPNVFAVNEDGDRPEKRAFCAARGIRYVVLKRIPKPGLPGRQSTHLRGY